MVCFAFSLIGAVHLVEDTLEDFREGVWNMVVENVLPLDRVNFPALGICEFGDKEAEFAELYEHIERYSLRATFSPKINLQHLINVALINKLSKVFSHMYHL